MCAPEDFCRFISCEETGLSNKLDRLTKFNCAIAWQPNAPEMYITGQHACKSRIQNPEFRSQKKRKSEEGL
jgi:hypothetical protein